MNLSIYQSLFVLFSKLELFSLLLVVLVVLVNKFNWDEFVNNVLLHERELWNKKALAAKYTFRDFSSSNAADWRQSGFIS